MVITWMTMAIYGDNMVDYDDYDENMAIDDDNMVD